MLRLILLICALTLVAAINVFAVHFGAQDSRRFVRVTSAVSGLLAMLCAIGIAGAFLRFLLSGDSLALTKTFAVTAILFTAASLILDIAIALRLRRNVA
jgi:hypothetical protein